MPRRRSSARYARFRHRSACDWCSGASEEPRGHGLAAVDCSDARRCSGSYVSINGARNAGLLALRILGSGTDAFAQQVHADLRQFSQDLRQTAMDKGAALRTRVAEAKAKAAAEREAEESSSAPRPIPAPEASSEPQAYVP